MPNPDINYESLLRSWEANVDYDAPIVIDYETISWDDKTEALYPYHGCRIGSIGLYQNNETKTDPLCIPIRHVTEGKDCWPIDLVLPWFKEFISKCKIGRGQNIKFEGHFSSVDGIDLSQLEWEDSMILARIVKNDLINYKLKTLSDFYCIQYKKKGDEVERWLEKNGTKDYGRVPLSILLPYLKYDLLATDELITQLFTKLPDESRGVWEEEKKFLKKLFLIEREGFAIDRKFLMRKKIVCLQEMIRLTKLIHATVGFDLDPNSDQQIGLYFNSIGIHSFERTKPTETYPNGNESWGKKVLALIHDKKGVADLLVEYSNYSYVYSNFCEAWLNRCTEEGRIHPTFWSSGTNSGRVSSTDPNAHNYPEWFNEAILIEPGYVGIKWDLSQIEYRIFCHYGNDEKKLQAYLEDPEIDYHQILADALGLPRKPTKTINFAILFGMGKAKTIRSLKKDIASAAKDPKEAEKVRKAIVKYASQTYGSEYANKIDILNIPDEVMEHVAVNILAEYHMGAPEIKQLQRVVKDAIYARGYVRNFYGRRYLLTYDKAYIGLNRVIQGSAADFFKKKVNALFDDPRMPKSVKFVNNIHDAVKAKMKVQDAQTYWNLCREVIQDSPFKVPLRIDGEAALYHWGNYTKIKNDNVLDALCKVYACK